jgi:hypothetical protein
MDVMEGGETAGSLALSLGLEPGARFTVVNPPEGLGSWFSPLPDGVVYQEAADPEPLDFVLLFASGKGDLASNLAKLRQTLKPGGTVWISWQRAPSPDEAREPELAGLTEVQRASIAGNWQAVRFRLPPKA